MLEDVIMDRAVEVKFLNRLTFINLSALYVAIQRQQPTVPQFFQVVLTQYTLLLRLLSNELQSTLPSSDIAASITPIVRRTTPSLRLYSKWLVINHSQVPDTFWHQYINTANSLQSLWSVQPPPKLSYPLEEDLAAAGFAPIEVQNISNDSRKRKHKRDRARIGNRKKGFDKLLLQWGRKGGDSSVSSARGQQGAEHPNVEMTLRLADLLSDAIEIASILVPSHVTCLITGLEY
jgi:Est1 DNA/RNA binding domain